MPPPPPGFPPMFIPASYRGRGVGSSRRARGAPNGYNGGNFRNRASRHGEDSESVHDSTGDRYDRRDRDRDHHRRDRDAGSHDMESTSREQRDRGNNTAGDLSRASERALSADDVHDRHRAKRHAEK